MSDDILSSKSRSDGSLFVDYRDLGLEMYPSAKGNRYIILVNKLRRDWFTNSVDERIRLYFNPGPKSVKKRKRQNIHQPRDYVELNPLLEGARKGLRYMIETYKGPDQIRPMTDQQWAKLEHTVVTHLKGPESEIEKLAKKAGLESRVDSEVPAQQRSSRPRYTGIFLKD